MRYLYGPATLFSFISAHAQAGLVLQARSHVILPDIFTNGEMPSEMRMLICATLSIRRKHRANDLQLMSLESCLNIHLSNAFLSNEKIDLELGSEVLVAPLQYLKEYVGICSQIALAEASFTTQNLPKVKRSSKAKKGMGLASEEASQQRHHDKQPSSTENYRICRALCRLWLYFELSRIVRIPKISESTFVWAIKALFFDRLTMWEIEEIECIHHHIKYQTQLWRQPCPECDESFLLDELIKHSPSCGQNDTIQRAYRPSSFSSLCCRFRQVLDLPRGLRQVIWADSPPAVDYPAAGFLYLEEHWKLLASEPGTFFSRRFPVRCYLDWGYCIWDRQRLEANRLIHRPRNGPESACERWIKKHKCNNGQDCRWRSFYKDPWDPRNY